MFNEERTPRGVQNNPKKRTLFSPSPVFQQPSPVFQQPSPVFQQSSPVFQQSSPVFQAPTTIFRSPSARVSPIVPPQTRWENNHTRRKNDLKAQLTTNRTSINISSPVNGISRSSDNTVGSIYFGGTFIENPLEHPDGFTSSYDSILTTIFDAISSSYLSPDQKAFIIRHGKPGGRVRLIHTDGPLLDVRKYVVRWNHNNVLHEIYCDGDSFERHLSRGRYEHYDGMENDLLQQLATTASILKPSQKRYRNPLINSLAYNEVMAEYLKENVTDLSFNMSAITEATAALNACNYSPTLYDSRPPIDPDRCDCGCLLF